MHEIANLWLARVDVGINPSPSAGASGDVEENPSPVHHLWLARGVGCVGGKTHN